jgi:hypothetical protein
MELKMKYTMTLFLLILIVGCNCKQSEFIINDDFLQDLSSEDNRIWGELYLDVFKGNLSALTYDYYIDYLDSTQNTSAEGMAEKIKAADLKLLKPGDQTFWLLLYYENADVIIADDASTDIGTVDTSFIYTNGSIPPDLSFYVSEIIKN